MAFRGVAFALALCLLATPTCAARAATYRNSRFGYSVSYPADLLIPGEESANGDGRRFEARRSTAKMLVWGSYNPIGASPDRILHDYSGDCGAGKPTYEVANSRLVAFSCVTPSGRIIYQKTLILHDVLTTVRFEYPLTERKVWDPVVRQVAASLRAGAGRN